MTNVQKSGNEVTLTMALTIQNASGADLKDSGVALFAPGPNGAPIATFPLIKTFPSHKNVVVSQRFTISRTEYTNWRFGANPTVVFLRPDGNGGTQMEPVDVHRELVAYP